MVKHQNVEVAFPWSNPPILTMILILLLVIDNEGAAKIASKLYYNTKELSVITEGLKNIIAKFTEINIQTVLLYVSKTYPQFRYSTYHRVMDYYY